MATDKRASPARRAAPRRGREGEAPTGEELRQLQILNDRISQVMEALRLFNEAAVVGVEAQAPPYGGTAPVLGTNIRIPG